MTKAFYESRTTLYYRLPLLCVLGIIFGPFGEKADVTKTVKHLQKHLIKLNIIIVFFT